jgi:TonB-linked SusC/RagA family outer membrane protein
LNSGQFNQDLNSQLFTDLVFDQKLDFITKGLSFAGKASLSTYYVNRILTANWTFPQYQLNYDDIGKAGVNPWSRITSAGNEYYKQQPLDINVGSMQGGYYRDLYYEFGFNYANTFGKHSVTGLALMNRQQKNKETQFAYYNEALVGRGTYDYDHRYLMEVNVGYTGSERFAPGNRFGFFPSGAVGWVVSEEKFFKSSVPWMSKLKLRYSDGLTGSDNAANRWLYISNFYTDNAGSPGPYIHEDLGANSTAQWEQARKRDLGIELGFLKNTLTFNIDFFDEFRDKMLLSPRSVTMLVGNTFKDLNLGQMKKHGLEVEMEFNKTTATQLNYWVKGIFGWNENRIIFKDDPPYAPEYTKDAGKALGSQINGVELTGTGYYTSVDDIHNNPSPIDLYKLNVGDYRFLDYKVDGKISSLDKYPIAGSTFPPITYSLSGGLTWKKFEFNCMFQGNAGKFVEYNQTYEVEFIKGNWRVHSSQLDYWTPNNQDVNHSTLHYSGSSSADILFWGGGEADRGYQIAIENRFWRNADYLRLKEVYFGYNMTSKALSRLAGVSNLTMYLTGNNLWTMTNLIEGDPERKDFQQGFYPQMTSVKLGVKVNF